MLQGIKLLRPMNRGVTRPLLVLADDGNSYVVKLQSNPLGCKVLVNEFLAKELGQKLQLCFPPGDLIAFDPAIAAGLSRQLRQPVALTEHFASQFLPKAYYVTARSASGAVNRREMAGILFFDHLFHNFDRTRNRRNLLLCREKTGARIYAIDHSHLFYRGRWQVESLLRQAEKIVLNSFGLYGFLLREILYPADFLPYEERFCSLTDRDFCEMIQKIPAAWAISSLERQALALFLIKRRALAKDIVAALCRLIPDRHRRTDEGKAK